MTPMRVGALGFSIARATCHGQSPRLDARINDRADERKSWKCVSIQSGLTRVRKRSR